MVSLWNVSGWRLSDTFVWAALGVVTESRKSMPGPITWIYARGLSGDHMASNPVTGVRIAQVAPTDAKCLDPISRLMRGQLRKALNQSLPV